MMSELRLETWTMPAADLGPENPLPPLHTGKDLHAIAAGPDIPADMVRNMAYGHLPNLLPYSMQDGYSRSRQPREFRVAVMENEFLRATFLLELGGRLWSLVHKPSGRELFHVNPVFQPANLALRNAWFSGGVEWNIGTIGHSPFTCAPLFAARVEGPDATPVLRLYEYERLRGVPFQIDAYLPDGSAVLFIRVRIVNSQEHEIPMYWWSNIAVPETQDTRVVVPTDAVYQFNYSKLEVMPVPGEGGIDITYPTKIDSSTDFFYQIPNGRRRWIAALNGEGKGLVQVSTDLLKGRKLFVWGMGPGGRRWQEFLSEPGQAYIEIQAGLARTQMEHLPMPPGEWAWLEAYGLLETDPNAVHGSDWVQAQQAVETSLEQLIPQADLAAEFEHSSAFADTPPSEIWQRGSGWGALECLRREATGEPPLCSEGLNFGTDSLTKEQLPWLGLLQDGTIPLQETAQEPHGFMVQAEWRALLEDSVQSGHGGNWLAWLHLGVMRHYAGDREGASQAWEPSLQHEVTQWAMRNLAVQAQEEGRWEDATALYVDAFRMRPDLRPLAVECGRCLIEAGRHREWLEMVADFPCAMRSNGRLRLLEAQAALAEGELEKVSEFFEGEIVIADLREGENSLTDLWFNYQALRLSIEENLPIEDDLINRIRKQVPIPPKIDFRMETGMKNTDI